MELQQLKKAVVEFVKDEDGLTMVEYAVAGSLVAAGAVLAFTTLGETIAKSIEFLYGKMKTA